MPLFRFAIVLLLFAAGALFAYSVYTGERRYRTLGLVVFKWTIAAALVFFAVLIADKLIAG
ncbi:MAG: hypothetical protein ABIW85_05915 [Variovorax sp.]